MLFYCVWPDEATFLVDVENVEKARAAAIEEVGKPPSSVVPFPPGLLGVRVSFDEDGEIVTDWLPHVVDVFDELEDKLTPDEGAPIPPLKVVLQNDGVCAEEALDANDRVIYCELDTGHEGDHRDGAMTWPNEQRPAKAAGAR